MPEQVTIMYAFIALFLLLLTTIPSIASEQRQCQAITYYECKNIGYNQTYLPNKFNHQDQKDVALVVSSRRDHPRNGLNESEINASSPQQVSNEANKSINRAYFSCLSRSDIPLTL